MAIFCVRWGTLVLVDGKTGANGLSLPRSPKPFYSAVIGSGRFRESAMATQDA